MKAMSSWTRVAVGGITALAAAWLCAGAASAQENFDSGKSGAQLYASNCAICHKSAQSLDKSGGGLFGLEGFLREHYTASRESAAAIAAYLKTVGGAGRPAEHGPAKRKLRTDKKNEKPSDQKPADKPSQTKPEKKEGGKAAQAQSAAARG